MSSFNDKHNVTCVCPYNGVSTHHFRRRLLLVVRSLSLRCLLYACPKVTDEACVTHSIRPFTATHLGDFGKDAAAAADWSVQERSHFECSGSQSKVKPS
ncbi:unnamed protein product [Pleuronectes platessa]|uniref:Uncharacterized protein n=1 Tax=Pleuronectes platessa TaxID=8262 RepID=A0A9N7TPS2_PLEPL|nr:unnamed protein product [Pleuronectes platessa]